MTMAGLEVEHVDDPAAKLAAFTVAKIVEAVQHPNADRLRVCQVDTVDGRKEIVCGAPNARAGPDHHLRPDRRLCARPGRHPGREAGARRGLQRHAVLGLRAGSRPTRADGIMELPDSLAVGHARRRRRWAWKPVIDFEVTPNRPDWLGVAGIARDLAAAGLGHAEGPAGRARARARSPARSTDQGRRRRLPGVRRPADPRRQERPLARLAAGPAARPSACARSTPWSISPT